MDIPRVLAMNRYWEKHPPLHLMVAAYLGVTTQSGSETQDFKTEADNSASDLEHFMEMFSAAGGKIG